MWNASRYAASLAFDAFSVDVAESGVSAAPVTTARMTSGERHILRATVTLRAGAAIVSPAGWNLVEQRGRIVVFEREDDGRYGTQWIGLPHDAFERLELTHTLER